MHDARSLVPQDQGRRRSRVAARQDGVVERGDAGGRDADKDPAISHNGLGQVHQFQVPVPGERFGTHGSHLYSSS